MNKNIVILGENVVKKYEKVLVSLREESNSFTSEFLDLLNISIIQILHLENVKYENVNLIDILLEERVKIFFLRHLFLQESVYKKLVTLAEYLNKRNRPTDEFVLENACFFIRFYFDIISSYLRFKHIEYKEFDAEEFLKTSYKPDFKITSYIKDNLDKTCDILKGIINPSLRDKTLAQVDEDNWYFRDSTSNIIRFKQNEIIISFLTRSRKTYSWDGTPIQFKKDKLFLILLSITSIFFGIFSTTLMSIRLGKYFVFSALENISLIFPIFSLYFACKCSSTMEDCDLYESSPKRKMNSITNLIILKKETIVFKLLRILALVGLTGNLIYLFYYWTIKLVGFEIVLLFAEILYLISLFLLYVFNLIFYKSFCVLTFQLKKKDCQNLSVVYDITKNTIRAD